LFGLLAISAFVPLPLVAGAQDTIAAISTLKRLSLEELLDIEVTLVSKTPQKLSEVPSAIQVITSEDIQRSGATRLPEALRLAANLMVAQVNSHDWAITARGFNGIALSNNTLANKLLVMIDGRTVYSALFGGVFWDVQGVVLEDVERIEIISGPGGTLWGANAVNGVINIITKSSRETKGIYASTAAGNYLNTVSTLRYGGSIGSKLSYRLYGRYGKYGSTLLDSGGKGGDQWHLGQGGFRLDYEHSAKDVFMLSGDFYAGEEGEPSTTGVDGQNVLARWTHLFSPASSLVGQFYFDRTRRNFPRTGFRDVLKTYDIDLQHGFSIGSRHKLLYGFEYRLIKDATDNVPSLTFNPAERTLQLFTGFVQDQVSIIPGRLDLTVGTKLLYNDYSHTDYQPSARVAFTASQNHTIWGAVSRAVRTPTRLDVDIINPGQSFSSEKQIAYEAGYRGQLSSKLSFSLAAFYSRYRDLRSINANLSPPPNLVFGNDQEGHSAGFELSGSYWFSARWRLRGGYTLFDKTITATSDLVVPGSKEFEGIDPRHQFLLQSILDLPGGFASDFVLRYVSVLEQTSITPVVPEYFGLDIRLAKRIKWFELSAVGQNLLQDDHTEFGRLRIPRSFYLRLSYRLIK
jgi:iron complex outermembrane receptor protein